MPNRMQEQWGSVRGYLKRQWPKLTEVDLDQIDGEYDRLIHKIKGLYGGPDEITQEAAIKGNILKFLATLP